jgi:RND family efflux transporter MFP subunit
VVTAPFDGVVTQRIADPGMMASPGVPLLKVQGGPLRLEAIVPESALIHVRHAASVPVVLDALAGRQVASRVVEIAPQGDPGSHSFVVKVQIPAGSAARAGMFGRARFVIGLDRRMLVPESAVAEREGLRYVYVVDTEGTARMRLVTVGDAEGGSVPVLSGLASGERIATDGLDRLTDGARVAGQG